MKKRSIIFAVVICFLTVVFVVQVLSQTQRAVGAKRTRPTYISPQQRRREFERRIRQQQIEREKRRREIEQRRTQWLISKKQTRAERQKALAKAKEESLKQVLGATQEQWKIIWPKLKKLQAIRRSAGSYRPFVMSGSSSSSGSNTGFGTGGGKQHRKEIIDNQTGRRSQVSWKWSRFSETKKPSELTPQEKIGDELLDLLEDKSAKQEDIKQKIEALRKYREKVMRQRAKAQQELREVLTFRQEATLVLMGWLD